MKSLVTEGQPASLNVLIHGESVPDLPRIINEVLTGSMRPDTPNKLKINDFLVEWSLGGAPYKDESNDNSHNNFLRFFTVNALVTASSTNNIWLQVPVLVPQACLLIHFLYPILLR